MKLYVDVFGKPLIKDDVAAAARLITQTKKASTSLLTRRFAWGYGKALRIMELLEEANVVSMLDGSRPRRVLLKKEDQAVNAALRQLRKGKP